MTANGFEYIYVYIYIYVWPKLAPFMGSMMGPSLGPENSKLGLIMAAENSKRRKVGPSIGTAKLKSVPMLGPKMGHERTGWGSSWPLRIQSLGSSGVEAMALLSARITLNISNRFLLPRGGLTVF